LDIFCVGNEVTKMISKNSTHAPIFFVGNEVAKNNPQHAIIFEAVALALAMEADAELLQASVSLLGNFISVREPNMKYLAL